MRFITKSICYKMLSFRILFFEKLPRMKKCLSCVPGQNDQSELPEALQSGSSHQAVATGVHHSHPPVDLRSVLQGEYTVSNLNMHTNSASEIV